MQNAVGEYLSSTNHFFHVAEHKWSSTRAPRNPSCDTERVMEVLYQPKASTPLSPSLAKIVKLHTTYLALEEDEKLHCTTQNRNSSWIQGVVIETRVSDQSLSEFIPTLSMSIAPMLFSFFLKGAATLSDPLLIPPLFTSIAAIWRP